jgi:hypothetical protein
MANFDPSANNGSGGLVFAKDGSLGDRALVNVNTRNFAPRFGFAYSADSKTVIRGGYGIFYSLFERYGSENQLALNYPNLLNVVVAASNNTTPVFLLRNGFPSSYLDPNQVSVSQVRVRAVNPHDPTPYVQQWSFGVQREIGLGFVAEADYVGTKSTHLDVLSDFNQHFQGTPAPYPNFGYIEYTSPLGTGTYHGLETSLTKRFSNSFSARVNYTWSRALDNAPDELNSNSGAPPNGRNFAAWHGLADFDTPHRVVANFVYDLPFGKGQHWLTSGAASYILGNWRVSGVYTFASGRPYTVTLGAPYSTNIDQFGAHTAVPNVIGTPITVGNVDCWFYVSTNKVCQAIQGSQANAFAPALGTFGNAGRNILRGPHTNVFDASLMKDIPIGERLNAQLRWEVFNVGNQVLFGQPNSQLTSGAVAQITSLAGDQRVMQLALRISY